MSGRLEWPTPRKVKILSDLPLEPEQIRDCYSRSIDSTLAVVAAITDDRWSHATPCAEWNVKHIVNHLVYENRWAVELFDGKTIEEVGDAFEGDLVGEDPRGVYRESSSTVKDILSQSSSMSVTCHISSGPVSGAEYACQLFLDSLIHGWDIAIGAGLNAELDAGLVEACMPVAELTQQHAAGSGAFAEPVAIENASSPQTRLLALLGRRE